MPVTRRRTAAQQAKPGLIELLYASPGDDGLWSRFLSEIVTITASRSARMLVLDRTATQVDSSIKINIDDNPHTDYVNHFVNACPWRPELALKPKGRLYSTYLDFACKQRDYYKTEFFNDWARPLDIHHGACGTVYQDAGQTVQLLVQRTGGQGHYATEDLAFLNSLVPHVRRVVTLHREVQHARAQGEATALAAGTYSLPFILLEQRARVSFVSPGAQRFLAAGHALWIAEGKLTAQRPAERKCLHELVRRCVRSGRGAWDSAGGWMALERPGGAPLKLLVMPVHPDAADTTLFGQRAFAAVFIYDPDAEFHICRETLRALYQLTPAEARLSEALALGETLEHYASSRKRSLNTLRAQLKAVFKKTGVARQAELVGLVLGGPAARRQRTPPFRLTR